MSAGRVSFTSNVIGETSMIGYHRKDLLEEGRLESAAARRPLAPHCPSGRPSSAVARTRAVIAAGIVLLLAITGCAASIPRSGGKPIAPPAPNHLWSPPPDAQANTSPAPNIAAGGGAIPPELAARASSLTLPEIVDLALRNNPATRESWAQAQASADAYGAARAAYFPSLTASATAARIEQPSGGFVSATPGTGFVGPRSTLSPSVSLSYTVLDFGVRSGNVASARATAYAVSFTHNASIQNTVLGVEQAFYTYVTARAVLEADQTSLREAQVSYSAAATRDSVGEATQADVLQARTAVAQAQLAVDSAQGQVQTTRARLAVAFGLPASTPYDVAANPEDVNVGDVTRNVDSLVADATRGRPDLEAARANVRAAEADVRAARGALLPSIGLSAASGYTDANRAALTGRNYSVSLGVSLPVFDGFARRYDVARAQANAQYEAASSEALRQSIISQVVAAYYQLQSGAQQVRTSEDLFASASAAMQVARARYDAGVASIVDLLTAQASLSSARAQRARSRWAWAQELAQLAFAIGALDDRGRAAVPVAAPSRPQH